MRRLALFPLPVVLFPGATTPLHIFEPRYRQMVARCLEYDRRFGLLYHDPDRLGPFERTPGRVGTVAEIGEFRILPDGRSLLLAHGVERFRIVDGIESDTAFSEALVEEFLDQGEDPAGGDAEEAQIMRRQRTLDLLHVVVDRLGSAAAGETGPLPPMDPAHDLSFEVAALIRTDPMWQYGLLSLTHESSRLDRIDELLREALAAGDPTRNS